MSENQNFGFGKFVPGFEFLQNIAKGSSQALPQMPTLSSWVAPTLNVEDLQKRIDELKAVHFWLDQNSKALSATVQALELQKMTLATLKGMNFNMADVANALKLKTEASGSEEKAGTDAATRARKSSKTEARGEDRGSGPDAGAVEAPASKPVGGLVDPLQWWGALTQQFQEIAAGAMKEASGQGGGDAARNLTAGATQTAMKMSAASADAPAPKASRSTPRKAAGKTPRKGARSPG